MGFNSGFKELIPFGTKMDLKTTEYGAEYWIHLSMKTAKK